MPEQAQYRTKLTQSGIFLVRYRTKIRDAGMPMPALVSSMPMPSYATYGDQGVWYPPNRVTYVGFQTPSENIFSAYQTFLNKFLPDIKLHETT